MIRHKLTEETKARRDEEAGAEARDKLRDARLRETSKEAFHTTGTI
jgi:hypothetical protein